MAWRIQNLNRKKSGPPSTEDISDFWLLFACSFGRSVVRSVNCLLLEWNNNNQFCLFCLVWFDFVLFGCLGERSLF